MKRQVDYAWRLAEIMAAHGMHNSTDLIPRLAERGVQLSRPQVYRVVHQRPEPMSLLPMVTGSAAPSTIRAVRSSRSAQRAHCPPR